MDLGLWNQCLLAAALAFCIIAVSSKCVHAEQVLRECLSNAFRSHFPVSLSSAFWNTLLLKSARPLHTQHMLEGQLQYFDSGAIQRSGNCGYTQETAEIAIASGDADMIAFGRLYIANPNLVDRFTNRQLLAETPATSVWYSGGAAGYTDFPQ